MRPSAGKVANFNAIAGHDASSRPSTPSKLHRACTQCNGEFWADARIGAERSIVEIDRIGAAGGIESIRDKLCFLLFESAGHIEIAPEAQKHRPRISRQMRRDMRPQALEIEIVRRV